MPRHGGQLHPLAAVYARSVLALAEGMLRDGRFRMTELFDEAPTLVVEDVPHVESLRNVNTLAEYEALLAGRESC